LKDFSAIVVFFGVKLGSELLINAQKVHYYDTFQSIDFIVGNYPPDFPCPFTFSQIGLYRDFQRFAYSITLHNFTFEARKMVQKWCGNGVENFFIL